MSVNIRPLHDRVVIQPEEAERTTAGGIVIPDSANTEKPLQGIIVAIGEGKRNDAGDVQALAVNVGDKVLYGKYAGTEVKLDEKELVVMREEDIMGIITA